MKRRIFKAIISIVLLTAFIMPGFSGCASSAGSNNYTVMQWLDKVERTFNLLYYTEQEPLVKTIKTSDTGFATVQVAAEWGIINPEDDIKFNDKLTKEFAADTLIRAMNCVTPSTVDISDSKKVKALYLDNVMSSVNEGIFTLEASKFNPKKKLTIAEADSAILAAHDKWVNFSYGESYDKSTIKENVINLGGVSSENSAVVPVDYSVKYTGTKTFFDENGGYTDNTGKTITFAANEVPAGLAVDTVLAMPADEVVPMNYAVVVTNVKKNSDGSVTVSTRNAELHEVYDQIDVQQSGPVDFSEAVFYGPDGKRVTFGDSQSPVDMSNTNVDTKAQPLGLSYGASEETGTKSKPLGLYRPQDIETVKMRKSSVKMELGDNFAMTLSTSEDGLGFGIKIEGKVEGEGAEAGFEVGFEEAITVENRIKTHWDWFKLKVDELRLSMTDTKEETIGVSCSATKNFGKINNIVQDPAKEEQTLKNILKEYYKTSQKVNKQFNSLAKKANKATNKKLLDIVIPSTNLHFVIRAELTVEGSLKLTFTQSNMVGVELVSGKIRPIHEEKSTQQVDFSAKIELAFRAALEFQLIGINIADIGFKAGVGAKVSAIVYSCDAATGTVIEVCGMQGAYVHPGTTVSPNETVRIAETGLAIQTIETRTARICNEFRVYPIVSAFGCSSSSLAGSLFGSIELEILNEDTPFFVSHYESDGNGNGTVVSECSMTANENFGIETGDKLTVNKDSYAVKVSEEADTGLAVATIPRTGSIRDINITSDNPEVLEVENLLHKNSTDGIKENFNPELKMTCPFLTALLPVDPEDTKVSAERSYKLGTWFYQNVADNPKPQFALTGKQNGMANVTITVAGQSVTVPVKVGTGIETVVSTGALVRGKGVFTLAPGETAQTEFDFIPEEKKISDISFSSSNASVAAVSKGGLITAVGVGDATITATLKGKEKEYSTTFTVHVVE